jgi:beta-lactamase regulating signal transducer with metallopeptidase domain/HEAT repeat protein
MSVMTSWLLTYWLQSTLLLGTAWFVGRLLHGRTVASETVWRVTLLGSIVAPLLVVAGVVRPVTGRIGVAEFWPLGEMAGRSALTAQPVRFDSSEEAWRGVPPTTATARRGSPSTNASTSTETSPSASVIIDSTARSRNLTAWTWTAALLGAWNIAAGMLLAWHFVRRRRLFTLLSPREVVSDAEIVRLFAELCAAAGLRRDVLLTSSPACPVPMTLTSSEICVPARFIDALDSEQQRGALAHEVAHVARRDPLWLTVDAIIGSLFFFQPLNVVARRALREHAEWQCDDWAVRQGSALGLARCLADVAGWLRPFPRSLLAVSIPMAVHRSDLVQRVERLLADRSGATPTRRSRSLAAACFIVAAVAGAAPAFSAAIPPGRSAPLSQPEAAPAPDVLASSVNRSTEAQAGIIRAPRPDDALAERWAWALDDARSRNRRVYWIGYRFAYPLRPNQRHLSDSDGISIDRIDWNGITLGEALGVGVDDGIAVLVRYRTGGNALPDRITHRSVNAPMDFGGAVVYWLGAAGDAESVRWIDSLQQRIRTMSLRSELVEALAMHRTATIVLPVLERLLGSDPDRQIRAEAAEGLEHHPVAAALQLAHETAIRDSDRTVRAEAAEAIGEMPIEGAVDRLVELANTGDDLGVRGEAAEALGSQPTDAALRGIEAVVSHSPYEDARREAIEALGDLEGAAGLPVLRRIIWEHPSPGPRVKAVETMGDLEGIDTVTELREILERHVDPSVRHEALEVLSGLDSPSSYALLLETAARGASGDARRDAIEAVGEATEKGRSSAEIEQTATLLERAIFSDPDESVQREAVEALHHLPRQRALAILRKVVDTHASSKVKREAIDAIAELGR